MAARIKGDNILLNADTMKDAQEDRMQLGGCMTNQQLASIDIPVRRKEAFSTVDNPMGCGSSREPHGLLSVCCYADQFSPMIVEQGMTQWSGGEFRLVVGLQDSQPGMRSTASMVRFNYYNHSNYRSRIRDENPKKQNKTKRSNLQGQCVVVSLRMVC